MSEPQEKFIQYDPKNQQLNCKGDWDLTHFPELKLTLSKVKWPKEGEVIINGAGITKLDSAAAWLLIKWKKRLKKKGVSVKFIDFKEGAKELLTLIKKETHGKMEVPTPEEPTSLYVIGKYTVFQIKETLAYLAFVGKLTIEALRIGLNPKHWRFPSVVSIIYSTGFLALPIIALLSFMIGVVITYQMGLQLSNYGANIYIVDLLGLAVLREFAPLLTAIMVAGRTGSAFTAELGMMKLNQEIDALDTFGVTSAELLLLPRIIVLTLVLSLLTMWANIFGIVGGMVMSNNMLGISWYDFLSRFPQVIPLKNLLIGLGKAPIFALIIASVGCFQGMQVQGGADSVGRNTTRSVVLSIFFIIVTDAIFSVLLSKMQL